MELPIFLILSWIISNWKTIVIMGIVLYIGKVIQDEFSFYRDKILDIDDNVRQIKDAVGVNNNDDRF